MNSRAAWILTVSFVLSQAGAAGAQTEDVAELEERALQDAAAAVAPSVVRIETLGGLETVDQVLIGAGPTTGLIVGADGYIVSSAFNFVQKPASILVSLPSGERLPAKLVATDHSRMLVLLKVDAKTPLPVPPPAPLQGVRVGQWAVALGRTFDAEKTNLSVGIVSAVGRVWGKAIQTDAKISPANYGGPLVDIHGRVLGVLAPLTPHGAGEVAGVEWYDSGIGFAVPFEHIQTVLPELLQGRDLRPGLLGVSLRGDDLNAEAALAACFPNSPAHAAGLRAGDVVVEIDGRKIERQADLKHAVAPRYSGDTIRIVARRGEATFERNVQLVARLAAYEVPFLGILPQRGTDAVVVRWVYPEGPAAQAGIAAEDRVVSVAGQPAASAAALREQISPFAPGESVTVEIERQGQTQKLELELGALPEAIPEPPAIEPPAGGAAAPHVGVIRMKVAEHPAEMLAYVPENYRPELPHGVVVWLHPAGGYREEELLQRWRDLCSERQLILLAPKAVDSGKWRRTEGEFIGKALDQVAAQYNVDRTRIVAAGYEAGGAMAYLLAFARRDLIRAVVAVEAPLPAVVQPPDNDPASRLAFCVAHGDRGIGAAAIGRDIQRLRGMKYPVTTLEHQGAARDLTADELADLVRWIDALDRI